jgi:hypothetical protein
MPRCFLTSVGARAGTDRQGAGVLFQIFCPVMVVAPPPAALATPGRSRPGPEARPRALPAAIGAGTASRSGVPNDDERADVAEVRMGPAARRPPTSDYCPRQIGRRAAVPSASQVNHPMPQANNSANGIVRGVDEDRATSRQLVVGRAARRERSSSGLKSIMRVQIGRGGIVEAGDRRRQWVGVPRRRHPRRAGRVSAAKSRMTKWYAIDAFDSRGSGRDDFETGFLRRHDGPCRVSSSTRPPGTDPPAACPATDEQASSYADNGH